MCIAISGSIIMAVDITFLNEIGKLFRKKKFEENDYQKV
jgi:hypothetical protein